MKINFLITSLRPRHWIKNLLVFLAPLLTFELNNEVWSSAFISFIVFNFSASSIYLLNDAIDYESDRSHPKKRLRPIAAGKLSRINAIISSVFLLICSLTLSFKINIFLFLIVVLYYLIQILYCLELKKKATFRYFLYSSWFFIKIYFRRGCIWYFHITLVYFISRFIGIIFSS